MYLEIHFCIGGVDRQPILRAICAFVPITFEEFFDILRSEVSPFDTVDTFDCFRFYDHYLACLVADTISILDKEFIFITDWFEI